MLFNIKMYYESVNYNSYMDASINILFVFQNYNIINNVLITIGVHSLYLNAQKNRENEQM